MFGVGAIPWSPLCRGLLTHPLKTDTVRSKTDAYASLALLTNDFPDAHLCLCSFIGAFDMDFLPELVGR